MSRFGLLFLVFLCFATSFSQVPSYVPTNGLVGWWPFNGNANDESGNGNNGTVNGATLTTDRFGNTGKAYSFNGINQWIEVQDNSSLDLTQEVTISVWIHKPIFEQRYEAVVVKDQDNLSIQGINYKLQINSNNNMDFYSTRGWGNVSFSTNAWHQFVVVNSMDSIFMYYDSNLIYTGSNQFSNGQLSNNNLPLTIGRLPYDEFDLPNTTGNERMYLKGKLDDIGIWNRALTQQEINELYTSSDPFDVSATTTTVCAGQPTTLSVQSVSGTITALNCASATNTGTLTAGTAASGVSSSVPYTAGNGGAHNGQTVTSTGVTGLTATLTSGTFATGNGSLTYTITGTPSASGTANFALDIGGQTCTLSRTVVAGSITTLSCGTATNNGTLIAGVAASGVNSVVLYTGGNGGAHNGQTVTSSGVTGLTATLTSGTFATGNGSLTYNITGTPSASGTANFALDIGGQTCALSRTVVAGAITTLSCGTATNNGTLIAGVAASGVNSVVPYTGGNGGLHNGQTVTSTGVTGLTATLTAGSFAFGNGSLTYVISGTPNSSGTAAFNLFIGGRSCVLNRSVECWSLTNSTSVLDVTSPVTGKIWMDRNLGAVRQAITSTDAAAYGDLYQWGRGSDGHQCRNSSTTGILSAMDQPTNGNFIFSDNSATNDWRNPPNANLWQGVNGINNPCPSGYRIPTFTEFNSELTNWTVVNAFGSVLKLPASGGRLSLSNNNGNLASVGFGGVYWTATISSTTSKNIAFGSLDPGISGQVTRSDGMSVRCIKETIGSIGALNCGSATVTGNLIAGSAATGVSASVPYTGGNGGFYTSQSVSSTGVTGLIASISQGLFASGSGNLVYTISGTPSASGTASFALNIGGQTCTLNLTVASTLAAQYPSGSVFCSSGPTAIVNVTNPVTGKTWMDRNLGASQVATISYDANSYGDLYQWGRGSDGHQCRNSTTTSTLSSTDQPSNSSFILAPNTPYDWRSPQNVNLWQGVNGVNNPCPSGYRIPTETELYEEKLSFSTQNAAGAFASPLKWPVAGRRGNSNGSLNNVGSAGFYWSSAVSTPYSIFLVIDGGSASLTSNIRAEGRSVRCIKN